MKMYDMVMSSFDDSVQFAVVVKQRLPSLRQIVNGTAQLLNRLLVISSSASVYQKRKIKSVSVDMAENIYNHGLCAANIQAAHNMQYPYLRVIHIPPILLWLAGCSHIHKKRSE